MANVERIEVLTSFYAYNLAFALAVLFFTCNATFRALRIPTDALNRSTFVAAVSSIALMLLSFHLGTASRRFRSQWGAVVLAAAAWGAIVLDIATMSAQGMHITSPVARTVLFQVLRGNPQVFQDLAITRASLLGCLLFFGCLLAAQAMLYHLIANGRLRLFALRLGPVFTAALFGTTFTSMGIASGGRCTLCRNMAGRRAGGRANGGRTGGRMVSWADGRTDGRTDCMQ